MSASNDFESFLKQYGCSSLVGLLSENEITKVEDFVVLETAADVDEFVAELGLKVMIRKKLKKAIMSVVTTNANAKNTGNDRKAPVSDEKEMDAKYEDEGTMKMMPVMTWTKHKSDKPVQSHQHQKHHKPQKQHNNHQHRQPGQSDKATDPLIPKVEYFDKKELKGTIQAPFTKQRPLQAIQSGKQNRTILIVGATGTGKTTALNSMANYIWGVKYNDTFRYKLIIEQFNHSQAKSMTQDVSAYYLDAPGLSYTLCVVDTPGFGDTDGIEKDKKITGKIRTFFETSIQEIDAICFVVRAPQARLTAEQRYVFNAVLSLFGKDIEENIFILINFCDGKKPPVLQALAEDDIPCKNSFKLNNSGFDLPDPTDTDDDDEFALMYWNMGMKAFEKFFIALDKANTKSLALTKQVLTRRKELECYIEGVDPLIRKGFNVLEQMRNTITIINANTKLIDANKNFEIEHEIDEAIKVPTASGVNTTTCLNCPSTYTCHASCVFSDNGDKERCGVMGSNGQCRVCPGQCHWSQHRNLPYTLIYKKKKVVQTVEDLKSQYYDAKSKVSVSDQLIAGLTTKLFNVEKDVNSLISNVRACVNELGQIALRPNVLNQDEYIDQMIQNETNQRKPGWQARVSALQGLKEKQSRLKQIHDTSYNPWHKYDDVQDYLRKNKDKYQPNNGNLNNNNGNNKKSKGGAMSAILSWFS